MEELKGIPIKRVLIELQDGKIIYDGKPDLMTFVIADKQGENVKALGGNSVDYEKISSNMLGHTIEDLEKLISQLALIGLTKLLKEQELSEKKSKTND